MRGSQATGWCMPVRPSGRVFTARTHKRMLGRQGGLDVVGLPTIDGLPWNDPAALRRVRATTEPDAELVYYDGVGPKRFDVLPLSVATDGGVDAVGVDRRRFRATSTWTACRASPSAAGSAARCGWGRRSSASGRCAAAV